MGVSMIDGGSECARVHERHAATTRTCTGERGWCWRHPLPCGCHGRRWKSPIWLGGRSRTLASPLCLTPDTLTPPRPSSQPSTSETYRSVGSVGAPFIPGISRSKRRQPGSCLCLDPAVLDPGPATPPLLCPSTIISLHSSTIIPLYSSTITSLYSTTTLTCAH